MSGGEKANPEWLTVIARGVGETGHVELRLNHCTEWDAEQLEASVRETYRKWFNGEVTQYGAAALPYIDTDDDEKEDDGNA